MPISFACPHCNRNYQVADQMAGQAVKCQACQNAIRVPAAQAAAPQAAAPQPAAATGSPIAFNCPACGKAYHVAAEMAGKHVKCQQCQTAIQVPAGGGTPQVPQQQPQPQASPISFNCPSCGRQYQVAASMAGKQAKCQTCQAVMQVPSGQPTAQAAAAGGGGAGFSSIFDEVTDGDVARWQGKSLSQDTATYSPHSQTTQSGTSAWKDGTFLVVRNGGKLPNRCIKTNEEAAKRFEERLRYTPGWVIVMWFLCGWPGYLVVSLMVSKTATVEYGLSQTAMKRGWTKLFIGLGILIGGPLFGGFLGGIGALFDGGEVLAGVGALLGSIMFLVGLIVCAMSSNQPKPKFINENETHMWLEGINSEFLSGLPAWSEGRPF